MGNIVKKMAKFSKRISRKLREAQESRIKREDKEIVDEIGKRKIIRENEWESEIIKMCEEDIRTANSFRKVPELVESENEEEEQENSRIEDSYRKLPELIESESEEEEEEDTSKGKEER